MSPGPAEPTVVDQELLETAQSGNESAYARLIEPHRAELHAHCYRMLGSVQDAEDALQEALLRAWKALPKFEGRSSLRSWLYRIATNTSLDAIQRRPKRILPIDYGPPADDAVVGEPLVESVWIEPYPDETLGIEDGYASPDARYEQRESIELAFIAALQHLPANQRAVLILREVLGFSAQETADTLDTSVASVNSALQRARATIEKRLPDQSQQETLKALGDEKLRGLVENYADAWERNDVDAVVSMLAEDAAFTMPPMSRWFHGDGIRPWLETSSMTGEWGWRSVPVTANGQAALAFYNWDEEKKARTPFAINVLTFEGEKIKQVDAFIIRSSQDPDPDVQARMPAQPADYEKLAAAYARFGLPDRLD
jgi:RNA polymerase sigma-70 factor, ECF subfamily